MRPIGVNDAKMSTEELKRRSFRVLTDDDGEDVLDDNGQIQVVKDVVTANPSEGGGDGPSSWPINAFTVPTTGLAGYSGEYRFTGVYHFGKPAYYNIEQQTSCTWNGSGWAFIHDDVYAYFSIGGNYPWLATFSPTPSGEEPSPEPEQMTGSIQDYVDERAFAPKVKVDRYDCTGGGDAGAWVMDGDWEDGTAIQGSVSFNAHIYRGIDFTQGDAARAFLIVRPPDNWDGETVMMRAWGVVGNGSGSTIIMRFQAGYIGDREGLMGGLDFGNEGVVVPVDGGSMYWHGQPQVRMEFVGPEDVDYDPQETPFCIAVVRDGRNDSFNGHVIVQAVEVMWGLRGEIQPWFQGEI